ncbi:MAG: FAD:protein FMN transferase [Candidatus Izemoplasmatales bacterium]|nr:FAD:protein FMN transferase [Candidatus Izemoplasmatales bacterium]
MKKILTAFMLVIISLTLIGCGNFGSTTTEYTPYPGLCRPGQNDGVYICEKTYSTYFDTIISFKIYIDDDNQEDIPTIFEEFDTLTEKYHQLFDKYNEYPNINNLYTINNSDGPVTVDKELFDAIKFAIDNEDFLTNDGELLFNIALHPVLMVWHEARNSSRCNPTIELGVDYCPIPSEEILNSDFNINPDDIILDEENLTIDFAKPNMGIDIGGFAKGYFSEIVKEYMSKYDLNYILNLGRSNAYFEGTNLDKDDGLFYTALSTPFSLNPYDYYGVVKLGSGTNMVTSGTYQRYFKNVDDFDDETLYHHIINPTTFYPGGEVTSVTIIYEDGAIGDILSTTLFLMSLEDGLDYVNNFEGLEALWYINEDEIVMSEGFADYLMEPIK